MSAQKYLIDTNVFFGLEDDREVGNDISSFLALANKHSIGVFVHELAKEDIKRDKDQARRIVSLSKISKFQILKKVRGITDADLEKLYGTITKPNDAVDSTLLHALDLDAADFLVTEDRGLHARARKHAPHLSRRILFIADASSLLRVTYEPIDVPLRYVEEVEAYAIPLDDDIFDSLREGYAEFDEWWREKCIKRHRKCWVVFDDGLAGLIVRKDETADDTDAVTSAEKILKICTFKVRPEKRGTKLGELLLKQALWFAQRNGYDLVYVTTYPEQRALIDLLEYYGFVQTSSSEDGELTYEKTISRNRVEAAATDHLFELSRTNFPRFYTGDRVAAYGVPIREEYHDILFPELRDDPQGDLFSMPGLGGGPKRPGNTIRKVYLCRAPAIIDQPGALIFFYKGRSIRPPSQAMTAIGVFEDMRLAKSTADLMRLTGGRSVYSEGQLRDWNATAGRPVKVINFLLVDYIQPPIGMTALKDAAVFGHHPPQSIFRIDRKQLDEILAQSNLGFTP